MDIPDRWQSITGFKKGLIDPSALKNSKIETTGHEKERKQKKPYAKKWMIPVLLVLAVLIIAVGILTKAVLIPERKYREGTALIEAGQYEAGIEVLQEIRTYKDAESQIRRGRSLQAEALLVEEEYEQAQDLFTELSGSEYAEQRIAAEKSAKGLDITSEPTAESKTEVTLEPTSVSQQIPIQTELQKRLSEAEVGNVIQFGSYEQDGNEENGKEPIEWIVLKKEDNRMLLVSKYALDEKPYHNQNEKVTWETCDLRSWLNDEFYKTAFSRDENIEIIETEINTPDIIREASKIIGREGYRNIYSHQTVAKFEGGKVVKDKCFILSWEELKTFIYQIFSLDNDSSKDTIWIRSGSGNIPQHLEFEGSDYETVLYFSPVFLPPGSKESSIRSSYDMHEVSIDSSRLLGVQPAIWVRYQSINEIINPPDETKQLFFEDTQRTLDEKQVGDIIQFGTYEQDRDISNGQEPIDWIILEKQDERILLTSKYLLDWRPYHSIDEIVTWETCDLRQWLNEEFFDSAFSEEQKEIIITTSVETPDQYIGDQLFEDGTTVEDKCFILSWQEIEQYLPNENRSTTFTKIYEKRYPIWWTRSGCTIKRGLLYFPIMNADGNIQINPGFGHSWGVRPSLWVRY